ARGGGPPPQAGRAPQPAAGAPPRACPAARPQSVSELLEEAGLEVRRANPPRRRDQRPDLAPPNETATAQLDALDLARAGPAADRRGPETDVRGGQDLRRLLKTDPVGRGGRHL